MVEKSSNAQKLGPPKPSYARPSTIMKADLSHALPFREVTEKAEAKRLKISRQVFPHDGQTRKAKALKLFPRSVRTRRAGCCAGFMAAIFKRSNSAAPLGVGWNEGLGACPDSRADR